MLLELDGDRLVSFLSLNICGVTGLGLRTLFSWSLRLGSRAFAMTVRSHLACVSLLLDAWKLASAACGLLSSIAGLVPVRGRLIGTFSSLSACGQLEKVCVPGVTGLGFRTVVPDLAFFRLLLLPCPFAVIALALALSWSPRTRYIPCGLACSCSGLVPVRGHGPAPSLLCPLAVMFEKLASRTRAFLAVLETYGE